MPGARRIVRLLASTVLAPVAIIMLSQPLVALFERATGRLAEWREWLAAAFVATLLAIIAGGLWDRLRHAPRELDWEHALMTLIVGLLMLAVLRMPMEHAAAVSCVRAKVQMRELQAIAAALEAYRATNGSLPATGSDVDALKAALCPARVRCVPTRDRWDRPLEFEIAADTWRVESSGPGGTHPIALHGDGEVTWPPYARCQCPASRSPDVQSP